MNQAVMDTRPQTFFAFLNEEVPPTMASQDVVADFEDEVDAINYSVHQCLRDRRGLTQMQLADEMKITRAVMTKIRQGQVAVPVNKMLAFIERTRSYALLQFYAQRLGLVLKTREQERADKREIAALKAQLEDVQTKYKRVVGDDGI